MKNNKKISKQDVDKTFKKLGIKKQLTKNNDFLKKTDEYSFEQKDIWVIADSTTSFINFNQN